MDVGLRESLELDGLRTYQPVTVEPWLRPRACEVNGDRLEWTGVPRVRTQLRGTTDLALQFADLHRHDDELAFAKFGRRFGPLYLCEHNLPMTHMKPEDLRYAYDEYDAEFGLDENFEFDPDGDHSHRGTPQTFWAEDLSRWRHWSEGTEIILRLITAALNRRQPEPDVWVRLKAWVDVHPRELDFKLMPWQVQNSRTSLRTARYSVSAFLENWIRWARFDLLVDIDNHGSILSLRTQGLFGAITADLIRAATGGNRVEVCTNCLRPFTRTGDGQRRTQTGKNPYCSLEECRKAISRDSKRRRRAMSRPT